MASVIVILIKTLNWIKYVSWHITGKIKVMF